MQAATGGSIGQAVNLGRTDRVQQKSALIGTTRNLIKNVEAQIPSHRLACSVLRPGSIGSSIVGFIATEAGSTDGRQGIAATNLYIGNAVQAWAVHNANEEGILIKTSGRARVYKQGLAVAEILAGAETQAGPQGLGIISGVGRKIFSGYGRQYQTATSSRIPDRVQNRRTKGIQQKSPFAGTGRNAVEGIQAQIAADALPGQVFGATAVWCRIISLVAAESNPT